MSAETIPDQFDGWLQRELQQRLSAVTPANLRPAQARYQALALSTTGGPFRLTKLKVSVAVAAGALAIGAAGAYAANTVTVQDPTSKSFTLGSGSNALNLIAVNGNTISAAPKWTNVGECVSFFANNRNYALAPAGSMPKTLTLFKNYHGTLVSFVASTWCKQQVAATLGSTSTTGTKGLGNGNGQGNGNSQGNGNGQGNSNGQGQGKSDSQGNGGGQGHGLPGQGSDNQVH
jgi:hypothetical protein